MSFSLALSGGVARGIAHLGTFKALNEKALRPDVVAGVSAGSIAGAFYCAGYSPDETLEIIKTNKLWHYLRPGFGKGGLFSLKRTRKVLEKYLTDARLEALPIPLLINAVDFESGELHTFSSGPVIPAILASSSIPLLFEPFELEGRLYVDGGVRENIPFKGLKKYKQNYLGVDVMNTMAPENRKGFKKVLERSIELITEYQEEKPEGKNLLCPLSKKYFSVFDLASADGIFSEAYHESKEWLDKNGAYLNS